jgi:hypothetical protein
MSAMASFGGRILNHALSTAAILKIGSQKSTTSASKQQRRQRPGLPPMLQTTQGSALPTSLTFWKIFIGWAKSGGSSGQESMHKCANAQTHPIRKSKQYDNNNAPAP